MFQRKLEKLGKYLPYYFRDWTITYINNGHDYKFLPDVGIHSEAQHQFYIIGLICIIKTKIPKSPKFKKFFGFINTDNSI